MSREVRRVPVDWQHPMEPNPNWEFQQRVSRNFGNDAPSRLLPPRKQFRPLHGQSYLTALAEWIEGREQWDEGTHEHLAFLLKYHSVEGWETRDGTREEPRTYKVYADDTSEYPIREFYPTTVEEILPHYPYNRYAGDEPQPEDYMPDFEQPEAERGWCLYETVSEGTPTTPVFATADELIDWLATKGEDYDQKPYRRAAAETLVGQGSSFGSLIVTADRTVWSASRDADEVAARMGKS